MREVKVMKFKSAVDWWYYLVIVAAAAAVLFAVLPPVLSGDLSIVFGGATILLSLGLPIWLLVSTSYWVDTSSLLIRSGPFSWTIALVDVQSIKPSRSVLSSPALSLNRLEIRYGRGRRILVSPADRDAFIDAVNQVTQAAE
jgi:uncharacterized membrane protein (UPF0182 family)